MQKYDEDKIDEMVLALMQWGYTIMAELGKVLIGIASIDYIKKVLSSTLLIKPKVFY